MYYLEEERETLVVFSSSFVFSFFLRRSTPPLPLFFFIFCDTLNEEDGKMWTLSLSLSLLEGGVGVSTKTNEHDRQKHATFKSKHIETKRL